MGFVWLGFGLAAIVVLWLLVEYPKREVSAISDSVERKKLENEIRRTALQIVGGAMLVVGLVGTYSTLQVSQKGQHADRFLRAVQLLGHESEEVRLGAIGSLHRLAEESPDDRVVVRNILAALVQSPRHRLQRSPKADGTLPVLPPTGEVESSLALLGSKLFESLPGPSINLSGVDCRGARLARARFPRALLVAANFEWADLTEADLSGADLRGAQFVSSGLNEARLVGAKLEGANLTYARLDCADLTDTDLVRTTFEPPETALRAEGLRLVRSNLSGQDFWEVDLPQADLTAAILARTNFNEANLEAARLTTALLYETDLSQAVLRGADLRRAHLWNVNFESTDLAGARLEGASLYTKDIKKALQVHPDQRVRELSRDVREGTPSIAQHLTQPQLDAACVDKATVLPGGFRRPPPCTPLPVPSPLCPSMRQ
jgi:hypothetical protein